MKEINSEYKEYPGLETGQGGWNDAEDVGGKGLFDIITIPAGETWTAIVEFRDGTEFPDITCIWKRSKRYEGYDDRITIVPENNSKSCRINALADSSTADSRYNEVDIRFEYKGMTYTRRFCVYTKH